MRKSSAGAGLLIALLAAACAGKTGYRTHSKATASQVARNPSRFLGRLYAFEGRVITATEEGNTLVFQMLVKDYASDIGGESMVVTTRLTSAPVVRGHEVQVLGYMGPMIEGKNAFGATVQSLSMEAIAVRDLTAWKVVWLPREAGLAHAWESGELFAPP